MAFRSGKLAPATIPARPGFSKQDKWKLASQLQKAIRHGRPDHARQAAIDLWALEPSYLRYRLAVISVEDVAAGTPGVVLDAFEGGWKKDQIQSRGGIDFLSGVAAIYAASIKDRTPCDLMYATRFVDDFQQRHGPWSALSWDAAATIAMDSARAWWERALCAWRCAGTDRFKPRMQVLPEMPGDWERWVALNAEAYGPTAGALMRVGESQAEHHHVFIGLALDAQRAAPGAIHRPPLPGLPDIGPWLSASLDKHTSEGRWALDRIPDMAPEASARLAQAGVARASQPDLIGRMWFWMEGSRCDQERAHPMASSIRRDNQARVLGDLPPQVLVETFGKPALWQQARQAAVGYRPAPRP